MDKGVLLFLNPETTKATNKKFSLETRLSAAQPPLVPQSTKNSSKPAINSISTYRLMQYQRQANNLRNANGATGAKRIAAKGKKTNWTTLNQSNPKRQITESSIRDSSIENSQRFDAPGGTAKDRQMSHKVLQESPAKGWCMLNNSISTGHPISVNINISNHLVSGDASKKVNVSLSKKTSAAKILKKSAALNTSKQKILAYPDNVLGGTQPVKGIAKAATTKAQPVVSQKSLPKKYSIEKSPPNPNAENAKKAPIVTKALPKPSVQLAHIQNLLKATITPKAQTQRFTFGATKKIEGKMNATLTTNPPTKPQNQQQASSQSILAGPSLRHDSNLRPPPSPKKVERPKEIKFPLTPAQTLKYFGERLTDYEKGEILDYDTIYFIGNHNRGFKRTRDKTTFDDDKGDYNAYVGDHIGYRYEIIDMLGKGSFGQAIKCKDHKTGEFIALKIIRSKKRFYHQATVEVKILKYIKDHDEKDRSNVVKMLDFFTFRKHICIVFELLSINLYDFIKDNNFKGLSLNLIRKFAVQILQSLVILREHSIIHCDLKPENILLKSPSKSGIKLIDFGSSCFTHEKIYTYIQSRFYRAPEIMLAISYTTAIDMWSFGCILAELFTGFPIFPGESEPEQMALIMEINGLPPKAMLNRATRREVFFDSNGLPLPSNNSREGNRVPGSKTLAHALKCLDADFIDFLKRCFVWEPDKRMLPDEALTHPWIVKGFPQLVKVPNEIQRHYATQETEAKEKPQQTMVVKKKPKLNQSLMNNSKPKVQSTSNLVGESVATPKGNGKVSLGTEQNSRLQDRLLQLRTKLMMMTSKTGNENMKVEKEEKRGDKKVVVLNMTEDCKGRTKQFLKQSNIF